VDEGLITRNELDAALKAQAERPHTPIGQLLVERGTIKRELLDAVLDKHRLGKLLLAMNVITSEQLDNALWRQRVTGLRLAEVLLKLRYVGEDQLRQALARHYGIALVDLDAAVLDPALARLIDRDYAWRHRLVPVGRTDDRLTVAMDDPGDRWVVEDLGRVTGCRIEVVTAPSSALRRAFGRIYGDRPAGATARELEVRHVETRRILAAVRAASEQVRQGVEADTPNPARRKGTGSPRSG
jgi:type IV pilus assembly protein PilB